ncbi:Uncharacterized protein DAT39_017360, partial [Clarias magur]
CRTFVAILRAVPGLYQLKRSSSDETSKRREIESTSGVEFTQKALRSDAGSSKKQKMV